MAIVSHCFALICRRRVSWRPYTKLAISSSSELYERKAVSVGYFLVSLIWLMAARASSRAWRCLPDSRTRFRKAFEPAILRSFDPPGSAWPQQDKKVPQIGRGTVGIGFELPVQTAPVVPNVPKSEFAVEAEVAVNCSEVS